VAVTGAAGFLGSYLIRRLAADGAAVSALDRAVPRGRRARVPSSIRWHEADLEDRAALTRLMRQLKPQVVFHLAGRVDLSRDAATAETCMRDNAVGTANLLWSLEAGWAETVVFTSTTDVYGHNPAPYREAQPVDPPSPYAVSKVAAEQLCRLFHRTAGIPAVILRLATVYGPGQARERLIPAAVAAALTGAALPVTSGEQRRNFLYVDDAVEGIVRAASPQALGETINLGGRDVVSLREVLETIQALTGTGWQPAYGALPRRANEPDAADCSTQKAEQLLGWSAATSLEQGLRATIEAFRGAGQGLAHAQ